MKKELVIEIMKNFFEGIPWTYQYIEEESVLMAGISMENAIGNIRIVIKVKEQEYKVYAVLSSHVETKYMAAASEYLHRVNFGLNVGNFELNYENGEVRYKTFVNFTDSELSREVVEESIIMPILMFDKYGKNLIKLMLGEGVPAELAENAEQQDDE